jgi:hypothetical protein
MVQYNQIMDRLFAATRKPGVIFYAEQKLALSFAYQPRRFFDKDVWVRAITDLTIVNGDTAAVIDYKTGKPKPQSAQLKLTAAVTFHTYPQIQTAARRRTRPSTGRMCRSCGRSSRRGSSAWRRRTSRTSSPRNPRACATSGARCRTSCVSTGAAANGPNPRG